MQGDRWRRLVLLAIVGLVWSVVLVWPEVGRILGFGREGIFFDLRGSLAAGEAAVRGLDPYAINPLDPFGRPHLYSTWWLAVGKVGLTRSDAGSLGVALLACFLAAVTLSWPVRGGKEMVIAGAVLVSPAWLLAIYRANNDLVIFIACTGVLGCLQWQSQLGRTIAAVLVGALTVLKYFPAAGLLMVLRAASRREMLYLLGLGAAVVLIGWPSVLPALATAAKFGPQTSGLAGFGAALLSGTLPDGIPSVVGWILGGGAGWLGYCLVAAPLARRDGIVESENRAAAATMAGAMLTLCFFVGTSYTYKFIFMWWMLPWLVRDAPTALGGRRAGLFLALILAELWGDGLLLAFTNAFAPGWSLSQRQQSLAVIRGAALVTQLGAWALIGACVRLAGTWSGQQWLRLARLP